MAVWSEPTVEQKERARELEQSKLATTLQVLYPRNLFTDSYLLSYIHRFSLMISLLIPNARMWEQ